MNASVVSALTTALWILIEAIQFGYMAYLVWRNKNDLSGNTFRLVVSGLGNQVDAAPSSIGSAPGRNAGGDGRIIDTGSAVAAGRRNG